MDLCSKNSEELVNNKLSYQMGIIVLTTTPYHNIQQ